VKVFRIKRFDGHGSLNIKSLSQEYLSDNLILKALRHFNITDISFRDFIYRSPPGIFLSNDYQATLECVYEASCRELVLGSIQKEASANWYDHVLIYSDEEIEEKRRHWSRENWEFLTSDDFKIFVENLYFSIIHMAKIRRQNGNFTCFHSRKNNNLNAFVVKTRINNYYDYDIGDDVQTFCCNLLFSIDGNYSVSKLTEYSFFILLVRDYLQMLIEHVLNTSFDYQSVNTHDWINFFTSFTKEYILQNESYDIYLAIYIYGLLFDFPLITDMYCINPNGPIAFTKYVLTKSFVKKAADFFDIDISESLDHNSEIITAFLYKLDVPY